MNVKNIPWSISRFNEMCQTQPLECAGMRSDRRAFSIGILYLSTLTLLMLFSGCTFGTKSNEQPLEEIPGEASFSHIVSFEGETLGLIASWYTGDFTNWKVIKEHNEGLDPNRIMLGDVIEIPEALLVREDNLPSRMVSEKKEEGLGVTEVRAVEASSNETPLGKVEAENEASEILYVEEALAGEAEEMHSETETEAVRIKSREELFKEMFD